MLRAARSRCIFFTLFVVPLASACTSEPDTGTTSDDFTATPCGTPLAEVDGIYAYSNGANTNTGNSCAGVSAIGTYLYQCVEFAQRYMNKRFGIVPRWQVAAAAEMCTALPAGVKTHWMGSGYSPKKGDLVVWGATNTNPWGHVAVVRRQVSGGIEIVEQNASINGSNGVRTLQGSAQTGYGGATCFVTALANNGAGGGGGGGSGGTAAGPTATCGLGDGLYCGKNGGGTDPSKLYRCTNGTPAPIETCNAGCEWLANPENDRCRTSAECPYGEGRYCGGNGITGDPGVLFECGGGKIVAVERCARGCTPMPVGKNDACAL